MVCGMMTATCTGHASMAESQPITTMHVWTWEYTV